MLHGEIREFHTNQFSFAFDNLLEPSGKGKCVLMILVFGKIPSWFSLPCSYLYVHRKHVICKRRLEYIRPKPYHVALENMNLICNHSALLIVSKYYAFNWGVHDLPLNETPVTHTAVKYIANLFSVITWHSLLNFQVLLKMLHLNQNHSGVCIKTKMPPGLPYDVTRRVIMEKSSCMSSTSNRILSIWMKSFSTQAHCQHNQVKCDDGTCISKNNICNSDYQCLLKYCFCQMNGIYMNDRKFCLTKCMRHECICPKHYFQCASGGCIQMAFICDGKLDCSDSSDEICDIKIMVSEIKENRNVGMIKDTFFCFHFLCPSGECIHVRYVDDLMPDCPGGKAEDESKFLQLRRNHKYFTCKDPTSIPCVPGLPVCYLINQLCLFDSDDVGNILWCRNGVHLGDCSAINCTNSYKCPESYCIPIHRVCDGYPDCVHGEDEDQCHAYVCKGLLRCIGTKICVHPIHVCDGVKNCPKGDDEEFCEMTSCPHNCSCLSHSIICTHRMTYIPSMPSKAVKYLSIAFSYMHHPNFTNICDQANLVLLQLSGNGIHDICESLQHSCRVFKTLIYLDISHNEIKMIRSSCFQRLTSLRILSLEHNPLYTLHKNALSLPLISYINIRHTLIKSLHGDVLIKAVVLYSLDLTETHIDYLDIVAAEILSRIEDFRFDDLRLCCIFLRNKNCLHQVNVSFSCPKLIPHMLITYTILPVGLMLVAINVFAVCANSMISKGTFYSKIITVLMIVDGVLAMYIPALGMMDLYYGSHFALAMEQWQRGILCKLMVFISTSTTLLTLFLSCLLVSLTSQAITIVGSSAVGNRRNVAAIAIISVVIIFFSLAVTLSDVIVDDAVVHQTYLCNFIAGFKFNSMVGILLNIILCTTMLALVICFAIATLKIIMCIRETTKEIESVSGVKCASSRSTRDIYKFTVSLIITKCITVFPYLLLQFIRFVVNNIVVDSVYIILAFILLECLSNPAIFILRPLLIRQNTKRDILRNVATITGT